MVGDSVEQNTARRGGANDEHADSWLGSSAQTREARREIGRGTGPFMRVFLCVGNVAGFAVATLRGSARLWFTAENCRRLHANGVE